MAEKTSFSLIALNFFVGLMKGHRDLAPLSGDVKALKYKLHAVEMKFSDGSKTVHPEAIAISDHEDHTVLPEWTKSLELKETKRQQIIGFSRVSSDALVDSVAAVPRNCSAKVSTWVIVRPEATAPFREFVAGSSIEATKVMLSSMTADRHGLSLTHVHGSLSKTKLSEHLSRSHVFRRCPRGYVRLSLDNLGPEAVCEEVTQELVSRLIRRSGPFDVDSLCKTLVKVWDECPAKLKGSIRSAVRTVLRQMQERGYCARWLESLDSDGLRWGFKEAAYSNLPRLLNAIEEDFDYFVAEVRGQQTQMRLFE